jgi:hypothetical protein
MNVQSQLRYLRLHAFLSMSAIVVLIASAFSGQQKTRFETIDVERINVVEKNGQIRLVISNKDRSPAPMERGQEFGYQPGNRAGIIFYNEEGTENGGLTYQGHRDSTGKYFAVGSLTFDQYEQDQTVALQYIDQDGRRRSGLAITDYPLGVTSMQYSKRWQRIDNLKDSVAKADSLKVLSQLDPKQRLYAGRSRNGSSLVTLSDPLGRVRLRLSVDSLGVASIEFLGDKGQVVRQIR